MDSFLARYILDGRHPERLRLREIPLLTAGDALVSRWWNRFQFLGRFVLEEHWRGIHGLMIPADAEKVSTTTENIAEYRR